MSTTSYSLFNSYLKNSHLFIPYYMEYIYSYITVEYVITNFQVYIQMLWIKTKHFSKLSINIYLQFIFQIKYNC